MSKAKGLGRGLDALFGEEAEEKKAVTGVRLSDIEPNPRQPRQDFDEAALAELAESIRQNGVITPITLRKTGDTYQIIAGERRWRASRMAGLTEIPATVLEVDEDTAYALALIENLQREDLNPIEEAEGFQRLVDELGMTQEQAAQRVGRSRPAVANALRLLNLPEPVAALVREKQLSAGHARALLALEDGEKIVRAAKQVLEQGLSVRQTEALVKIFDRQSEKKPRPADLYIADLERTLAASTGHKVSIQHGAKKGRLVIEYYGNDDLEAVCQALRGIEKHQKG